MDRARETLLAAMEWALEHSNDTEAGTDIQEVMRQQLFQKADKFMETYSRLAPPRKEATEEAAGQDEGTGRVTDLIDRLLAQAVEGLDV